MSTLDDWLSEAGAALSLPPGPMPTELRDELLDLTRDVAHGIARIAGPLTTYLIGVAVGRGASPAEAVAALTALVKAQAATAGARAES